MKSFFVTAALGVALALAAGSAQAQDNHKYRHHSHHSYSHDSDSYSHDSDSYGAYGSGSNIINSNCPAGTQPHVWPTASGYRCL